MSETKEKLKEVFVAKPGDPEDPVAILRNQDIKDAVYDTQMAKVKAAKAEAEAKEKEAKNILNKETTPGNFNALNSLMLQAGVAPEKTAGFIKELGEEGAKNLAIMMSAGGGSAQNPYAFMQFAKKPDTSVEDLIRVVKLVNEGKESSSKDTKPVDLPALIRELKDYVVPAGGSKEDTYLREQLTELRGQMGGLAQDLHNKEMTLMTKTFSDQISALERKLIEGSGIQGDLLKESATDVRKMLLEIKKEEAAFDREMRLKTWDQSMDNKKTNNLFKHIERLTEEGKPLGKILDKAADRAGDAVSRDAKRRKAGTGQPPQPPGGQPPLAATTTTPAETAEWAIVCANKEACGKTFTVPVGTTECECPHCGEKMIRKP